MSPCGKTGVATGALAAYAIVVAALRSSSYSLSMGALNVERF
jgi:hypothetical protein